jgi:hypothetical protein
MAAGVSVTMPVLVFIVANVTPAGPFTTTVSGMLMQPEKSRPTTRRARAFIRWAGVYRGSGL